MVTTDTTDETAIPEKEPETDKVAGKNPIPKSRRRKIRILAGIVVVIGLVVGLPFYLHSLSYESSNDAFIDGHIVPVSARISSHVSSVYVTDNQRVKAGDLLAELDPKDFQARLDAARAALEAAKAVNEVNNINVDLTTTTSTADMKAAKANVRVSEAGVQTARASADAAESQADQARAQLDFAVASRNEAQSDLVAAELRHQLDAADLKRYRQMAATISAQQMDHAASAEKISAADMESARKKVLAQDALVTQAGAAVNTAESNYRQALARVDAARSQLDQARERLSAAKTAPRRIEQSRSQSDVSKADVHKAMAAVDQTELNLSYTKIYAPCDGFVTKKNMEPGAYVQAGQALLAIVSPDVWVTVNFKETQLTHMRPGQSATITADAYPDVTFNGHVESIQHGTGARFSLLPPENATGNYVKVVQRVPVKIVFDDRKQTEKYLLVPGMSVVPEVNIKAKARPVNPETPQPVEKTDAGLKTDAAGKK